MRVVIYARYSSENQREASLEDQLRICKERVTREAWELVQVFQDRALSGASTLRPGYQALLAGAREGAFECGAGRIAGPAVAGSGGYCRTL